MDQGTQKEVVAKALPPEPPKQIISWETDWALWYAKQRDKLLREEAIMETQTKIMRNYNARIDPKNPHTSLRKGTTAIGSWVWACLRQMRTLLEVANKHEQQLTSHEMALAKVEAIVDGLDAELGEYREFIPFLKRF